MLGLIGRRGGDGKSDDVVWIWLDSDDMIVYNIFTYLLGSGRIV